MLQIQILTKNNVFFCFEQSTVLFRLLPSHVTSSRLQFVFLGSEQQTLVFSNGVTKGGVSIGDNCKFISLSVIIISFAFSKHSAARLLAKNPQKVVTDDPTCFVDYKATFEILECTQCHVGTSAINQKKWSFLIICRGPEQHVI